MRVDHATKPHRWGLESGAWITPAPNWGWGLGDEVISDPDTHPSILALLIAMASFKQEGNSNIDCIPRAVKPKSAHAWED